jgi:hypothetical protein
MAIYQYLDSMPRLLEQTGFRVRGKRADCAKCTGRSQGTVSFNGEVAYCHRCNWSANRITLARELGLFSSDSRVRQELRREQKHRESLERPIHAFEQSRDAELLRATKEHCALSRKAVLAEDVLRIYPDCDSAWNALAVFYHRQPTLNTDLDRLSCAKVSDFLESPYTIEELFLEWRTQCHAA